MTVLEEVHYEGDRRIYEFNQVRVDGVALDSLRIELDSQRVIQRIEILHNVEGDACFDSGGQLVHCTAWESETEAQSTSEWLRHYTARLGKRTGTIADARRIFRNLYLAMQDNYLKHLLGIFPAQTTAIAFDEQLYPQAISKPIRAIRTIEEAPGIGEPQRTLLQKIQDGLWATTTGKLTSIATSVVTLVTISVTASYFFQAPTLTPADQELLSANLLPALDLVEKQFPQVVAKGISAGETTWVRIAKEEHDNVAYENTDKFLDQIYLKSQGDQIRIFHHSVLLNQRLTVFEKARILGRMYRENLIRLISTGGTDFMDLAHQYLQYQMEKNFLIEYLTYLLKHYPKTAISMEAGLIFAQIVEIQSYSIHWLLFQPAISEGCREESAFEKSESKFHVVCAVHRKYANWRRFGADGLRAKFLDLRRQILNYVVMQAESTYRVNDAGLELIRMNLQTVKSTKDLRIIAQDFWKLRSDLRDFHQLGPYRRLAQTFSNNSHLEKSLGLIERDRRLLDYHLNEVGLIRGRLDKYPGAIKLAEKIEIDAWSDYQQSALKKLAAREKRLSSLNSGVKIVPKK
jgi:hypothetical protein